MGATGSTTVSDQIERPLCNHSLRSVTVAGCFYLKIEGTIEDGTVSGW